MPLMTWQESYSVHVPEFDAQHKHLIDLLNRLYEAMTKGHASDVLSKILHELVTYTKTHFQAEERLMQSKHYSGYAAHKAEHEKFTAQVTQFQREFSEGKASLSTHLLNFLKDWLTNHIVHTDKQYSVSLNAAN